MIVRLENILFERSVRTPGNGQSSQKNYYSADEKWDIRYHVDLQLISIKREGGDSERWTHASNMLECTPDPDSLKQARSRQKGGGIVG